MWLQTLSCFCFLCQSDPSPVTNAVETLILGPFQLNVLQKHLTSVNESVNWHWQSLFMNLFLHDGKSEKRWWLSPWQTGWMGWGVDLEQPEQHKGRDGGGRILEIISQSSATEKHQDPPVSTPGHETRVKVEGFPGCGWESACQFRRHGFYPWSGKIPPVERQLSPWATTMVSQL